MNAQDSPAAAEVPDTPATPPSEAARELHQPAWRGHATTHANLVLEGGAMRGQFTAGVLDFFMDQKLFCERVIGVSAGALCGYNYVAGEDGRTCYLNTKYCTDWRYLSMQELRAHGQRLRARVRVRRDPQPAGAVRLRRVRRSRPCAWSPWRATSSPARPTTTSSPTPWPTLPYLIASSSMPLVSQHRWRWTASCCWTAAPATACPSTYSLLTGARKHIVVLTQAADYVKGPNKLMALLRQRYHDLPPLPRAPAALRHYEYNRTLPRPSGACTPRAAPSSSARPSPWRWPAWRRTRTSCSPSTSRDTPPQRACGPNSCAIWRPEAQGTGAPAVGPAAWARAPAPGPPRPSCRHGPRTRPAAPAG